MSIDSHKGPERFPIPAEVVEVANRAYETADVLANSDAQCMEDAIRAALDKLGLREERRVRRAFVGPDDVEHPDEIRVRWSSDWRPVDEEPSAAEGGPS